MLYEHFNNTFWEKVETIGVEKVESIAEEIRQYSGKYKSLNVLCLCVVNF